MDIKNLFKDTDSVLFISCMAGHSLFSPVFFYFNIPVLGEYSITVSIIYLVLLFLKRNLPNNFTLMFIPFEILCYSILVTVLTGNDAGCILMVQNSLALTFLVTIRSKYKQLFHLGITILLTVGLIFILVYDLFISPLNSMPYPELFYKLNYTVCFSLVIILMTYESAYGSVIIAQLTTQEKDFTEKLSYIANHDPLTGLMNRRRINTFLYKAHQAKQEHAGDYAVCIFDIDHFKNFNDTYGHDCGDFMLQEMTAYIQQLLPSDAQLARWGGEEFIILFTAGLDNIYNILDSIRNRVAEKPFTYKGQQFFIHLTFGVSTSAGRETLDDVIKAADDNLLYGKRNGRNQVVAS